MQAGAWQGRSASTPLPAGCRHVWEATRRQRQAAASAAAPHVLLRPASALLAQLHLFGDPVHLVHHAVDDAGHCGGVGAHRREAGSEQGGGALLAGCAGAHVNSEEKGPRISSCSHRTRPCAFPSPWGAPPGQQRGPGGQAAPHAAPAAALTGEDASHHRADGGEELVPLLGLLRHYYLQVGDGGSQRCSRASCRGVVPWAVRATLHVTQSQGSGGQLHLFSQPQTPT